MSEELIDDEIAHDSFEADSDCSSVSTLECGTDDSPNDTDQVQTDVDNHVSPHASNPDTTRVAPTQIIGDISSNNVLNFRRVRKPRVFFTSIDYNIPNHYNQAVRGAEASGWLAAIRTELEAMARLNVWEVVDLTSAIKTVGTTWVFRKKKDGTAVTFKARLCAQGFSQVHGIDFSKTFAPTGRLNSLHALISHAAATGMQFHQLDVKTAFLNADLDEEVFLSIPQGINLDKKRHCLRLNKAIYGLKQAPLAWYNRLSAWLVSVGFKIAISDPCVFYRLGGEPVWIFVHVDDLAVFSKDVEPFKKQIKAEFDMKDMGQAHLMLGIKILHEEDAIVLSQLHYVNSLLELYGMVSCRPVSTPLVPNAHLAKATVEEQDRFKSLGVNYRSAVGGLSYLSTATRPDIAFAVSSLSQFLECPGITHWESFIHVLRYLAGTANTALVYKRNQIECVDNHTPSPYPPAHSPAAQKGAGSRTCPSWRGWFEPLPLRSLIF
jgi:hypothetical protein